MVKKQYSLTNHHQQQQQQQAQHSNSIEFYKEIDQPELLDNFAIINQSITKFYYNPNIKMDYKITKNEQQSPTFNVAAAPINYVDGNPIEIVLGGGSSRNTNTKTPITVNNRNCILNNANSCDDDNTFADLQKRNLDKFQYILQMDRDMMVNNSYSNNPNYVASSIIVNSTTTTTTTSNHNYDSKQLTIATNHQYPKKIWNLLKNCQNYTNTKIIHNNDDDYYKYLRIFLKFLLIFLLIFFIIGGFMFLIRNNINYDTEKNHLITANENLMDKNVDDYPEYLLDNFNTNTEDEISNSNNKKENRDDAVHLIDGTNYYYVDEDDNGLDKPKNTISDDPTTMHNFQTSMTAKVSPTIPMIFSKSSTTTTATTSSNSDSNGIISITLDPGLCMSVSLAICQGVQQYDLTANTTSKRHLTAIELETFQYLFTSKCSKRVPQFICSILEPECRPEQQIPLPPCKRICKSILESCADIIDSSLMLSTLFDCDQYPDSFDNNNICVDPTRGSNCYQNEFQCQSDLTCIPKQWKCDNIKDCLNGEDEENCTFCAHNEFRCKSNDQCISDQLRCNNHNDCQDNSDEDQCQPLHHQQSNNTQNINHHGGGGIILLTNLQVDEKINGTTYLLLPPLHDQYEINRNNDGLMTTAANHQTKPFTNLANFQESKEIMMTSSSEDDFKYSQTRRNQTKSTDLCPANQLRCVSGKCITVDALCDKIIDCPDGTDEAMCVYKT